MVLQGKYSSIMSTIAMVLMAATAIMALMVLISVSHNAGDEVVADAKKLAGELADNNLPYAAVEEYQKVLDRGNLSRSERGAVNYLIGKIYFEDIGDYEKAAAYFVRARALDEHGSYVAEAGKNLITSLERLGRRLDARRELDFQTSLEPDTSKTGGKLVAKVGAGTITVADFNAAAQSLPPDMQDKLTSPAEKRKFLDQLIGRELIYHAALREGLDKEDRLQKEIKNLEKELLIQFYTREKIAPTVRPDTNDLKLYFNANKQQYGDKALDEVKDKVVQDYMNYVGQKAINEYISGLLKAEPVQVFEENLK